MLGNLFGDLGNLLKAPVDTEGVAFWERPDRQGWLSKQGDNLPDWRRRWFVLKDGKIFWFKDMNVTPNTKPRGVIDVRTCKAIKGAEDNPHCTKPNTFELSTDSAVRYFVADGPDEMQEWIQAVGRAIVKHSSSRLEEEVLNY